MRLNLPEELKHCTGKGVKVAVIDSGIDLNSERRMAMKKNSFMKERGLSHSSKKIQGFSSCPKELDSVPCYWECVDACYSGCYPSCFAQCQAGENLQTALAHTEGGSTSGIEEDIFAM